MQVAALTIEFRNPAMTTLCIASLLDEGVSLVLVVDNSDDGGMSVSTLRERFASESRVELLEAGANLGFAAGVNLGLAHLRDSGRSAPTLLVNNDAVLVEGALNYMLTAFEGDPAVSLVYPTVVHAGQPMGLTYYHRATGLLTRWRLPGSFPFVSGCCMLVAPGLIAGDLFDDTFFMYGEDVELSWRLARQHVRVAAASNAIVNHVGSAASGLGSDFYEMHMAAGHIILARRLARGHLSRLFFLACRAFTLPMRASLRCVRFRSFAPLRALGRGMSLAGRALHRRHTRVS